MATSSLVPSSNVGGVNQTSPAASSTTTLPKTPMPMATPGTIQQNPYAPVSSGAVTGVAPTSTGTSYITQGQDSGQNALQKQLTDIYGQGTGASLYQLLSQISGTNSASLQEFINSLAPQEAKAQANLGANLGAMGVGGNSSVAALGEAGLQSDIFSTISGEAANLTQSQQDLTAQLLSGMAGASAQEVASSGWDVFGQALGAVGNLAGSVLGTKGISSLWQKGNG